MTGEYYARKLKSKDHPYLLEVSTIDTITDGTRNDQIDIGLGELKSFSTAGDIYGIKSVLFTFDGGIIRIHFPEPKRFEKDYLEIAENMKRAARADTLKLKKIKKEFK